MKRLVVLFAAAVISSGAASAQTADLIKEGGGLLEKGTPVTVEYDVRRLLFTPGSPRAGFDSIEQVLREVAASVEPGTWNKNGHELAEKNGTHLVVTATAGAHDDIKKLLKTLTARTDLAVDLFGTVYELDRKTYETALVAKQEKRKPELGRPVPVTEEWAKLAAKHGQIVMDGTPRIANGRSGTVVSKRKVVEFMNTPWQHKPGAAYEVEFVGTTVTASAKVPRQRRSVFVTVTETVRELADPPKVSEVVVKSDAGEVEDGGFVAFPLSSKDKDKVRVMVLRPVIFIQAEEDEIKKQPK